MTCSHLISSSAAVAGALILASSAMAGGEPKHVVPFMRSNAPAPAASIAGEPKNMLPFTQPFVRDVPVENARVEQFGAGPEPSATRSTIGEAAIVTKETHAFRWLDALLGAATTAAVALVVAGIEMTRRARQQALGA